MSNKYEFKSPQSSWLSANLISSYCERSTTHGLAYLVKRETTLIERCLWLMLLIVSICFCLELGLRSVNRYHTKCTVLSLERDFHNWNTTLPSVTVCPLRRLDIQLFDAYCRSHNIKGQHYAEFYHFLEHLANSSFHNFKNIPQYDSIDSILDALHIQPAQYMQLIYNLTRDATIKSDADLIKTKGSRIRGMSSETVIHSRQVLTEYGLCYLANTQLDEKYSAHYMIYGDYMKRPHFENVTELRVKRGHYFEADSEYSFVGFADIPIDIFTHSAFEVMQIDHNLGYTVEVKHFFVESMEMLVADEFKDGTSVAQRKCRLQHESNLTHFPIYTKNLCLQECRLNLILKLCKCIPHFYPNRIAQPKPVCSYKTLRECLPQYEELFMKFKRPVNGSKREEVVECPCMQNCEDAIINIKTELILGQAKQLMGGGMAVVISMPDKPTLRLRRQIVFSFSDLLVSIGGTAGLFLGFSVLGAVEFIYYLTFRLFFSCVAYKKLTAT